MRHAYKKLAAAARAAFPSSAFDNEYDKILKSSYDWRKGKYKPEKLKLLKTWFTRHCAKLNPVIIKAGTPYCFSSPSGKLHGEFHNTCKAIGLIVFEHVPSLLLKGTKWKVSCGTPEDWLIALSALDTELLEKLVAAMV